MTEIVYFHRKFIKQCIQSKADEMAEGQEGQKISKDIIFFASFEIFIFEKNNNIFFLFCKLKLTNTINTAVEAHSIQAAYAYGFSWEIRISFLFRILYGHSFERQ